MIVQGNLSDLETREPSGQQVETRTHTEKDLTING